MTQLLFALAWSLVPIAASAGSSTGIEPLPPDAKYGEAEFRSTAAALGSTQENMSATLKVNPLQFPVLTYCWAAWELTDRKRVPALLIDDMQVEYEAYVRGILPQVKLLVAAFREAGLPIFWSAWWRFGPEDGFFNAMDRFYGPIGWRTPANALYLHHPNGGDVLAEIGPVTEEERRRVMHKSYSLDMFDERLTKWLVPSGQGTLHVELQKLGVDTIVQTGAWTDDCIISTCFHAFSLQYDVVVVEDGVSTASEHHWSAIEVMRAAAAKVMNAAHVASYIRGGLPVAPSAQARARTMASDAEGAVDVEIMYANRTAADQQDTSRDDTILRQEVVRRIADVFSTCLVGAMGVALGYLWRGRTMKQQQVLLA